jgi:hypothetical protein
MTDDLIAFLNARLAEDAAKVAAMQREKVRVRTAPIFQSNPLGWLDSVDIFVSPDRWRAEVDAKRRIIGLVDDVRGDEDRIDGEWGTGRWERDAPDRTSVQILRSLALPYVGHPDYREEWRP